MGGALARHDRRAFPALGGEDLEIRRQLGYRKFSGLLPENLHIGRVGVADLADSDGIRFGCDAKAARGRAHSFEYQ